MRPWPDERHVAPEDVKELGQFIEARPAQKSTNSCHAKIVPACLRDDRSVLENRHRPELVDNKFLGVETASPLPEYDLTGFIKFQRPRQSKKAANKTLLPLRKQRRPEPVWPLFQKGSTPLFGSLPGAIAGQWI